jgi:tetratricopeptide (TPR) repeat protein
MKHLYLALIFIAFALNSFHAKGADGVMNADSNYVMQLTKQAYDARLSNAQQTINSGNKALELAIQLNFNRGIAESYRVIGIGQFYLNDPENAINSYLKALTYFQKANDKRGEAKVYYNIGNLYRDNNFKASLDYFNKSVEIGNQIHDKAIIATANMNIGNFYSRKNMYNEALKYYHNSEVIFAEQHDSVNLILCAQNRGVAYFSLNELDTAAKLLTYANKKAKERDMNESVASIDLSLASLYIAQSNFDAAAKAVSEGLTYTKLINDKKLEYDFNYTSYQLEYKRGNYKSALGHLSDVFKQDSLDQQNQIFAQINIYEVKHMQEEQRQRNQIIEQQNHYERVRFWMAAALVFLLIIVTGLLVTNVKRKARTNLQLTELNGEVLRQKDNLDRVNHHLEEIIDERTKDLQIKNRKLSEYSSYLSHQIRGPIATLKGLMNLEKEGLIDKQECISMMDKCVSEIDDKIIEMSDMMHDSAEN